MWYEDDDDRPARPLIHLARTDEQSFCGMPIAPTMPAVVDRRGRIKDWVEPIDVCVLCHDRYRSTSRHVRHAA